MVVKLDEIQNASIDDIIYLIEKEDSISSEFIGDVEQLRGASDRETLRNVWKWVRENVRYKEDGGKLEIIKSPRALLLDGVGDCKSMSVLAGAIIRKLGFPFFYRVVFYDPENPNTGHIYVVARASGGNVIVDPVDSVFDREQSYFEKIDLKGSSIGRAKSGNVFGLALLIFFLILIK
jgi:hypothetical protein